MCADVGCRRWFVAAVGRVVKDDMDSKPLKVELVRGASSAQVGFTSFYRVSELAMTTPEPRPPQGTGHSGEFRDHGVLSQLCSLAPDQLEGAPCLHGSDLIQRSHWSCCGGRWEEKCTRVAPATCTFAITGRKYIAQVAAWCCAVVLCLL